MTFCPTTDQREPTGKDQLELASGIGACESLAEKGPKDRGRSIITNRQLAQHKAAAARLSSMVGGRKSKSAGPAPPSRTLVLDNGGYTIKAGFVSEELTDEPRVIPNCIARDRARKVYVASDVEKCRDFGEIQFRRPVEKGFIVNWEAQKEIWDHEFFDDSAPQKCDPSETRLLLAEQPSSLPVLQSNCDQIVFEEYQFASYYRGIGMPLYPHASSTPCCVRLA